MHSYLPSHVTPFIGREDEQARLLKLLEQPDCRLITILGAGGVGKTRLAFSVAASVEQNSELPVFSVILDTPQSWEMLSATIANALGCNVYGDERAETQLLTWMRGKRFLLLLDNFEHVESGAGFMMKLLNVPSEIRFLVTSRERLGLHGETVFALKGFQTPMPPSVENALDEPAIRLFVNAAQRADAEFMLKAEYLPHIHRICRQIEGLPLAIELAAAWIDTLSVREIASEIEAGYSFLSSEFQDLPERHRSIAATFESSWKRLSADTQSSLMRMAVFHGGFTRQAALAVTGADVHSLQSFVNKSLLRYGENERYSIHELLRQYLRDKLDEANETEAVESAHSRHFLNWLHTQEPLVQGREQREALDRIEHDFGNVRFAWENALKHKQIALLYEATDTLFWFCMMRNHYYDGEALLERIETLRTEKLEERLLQARAYLRRLWMERWRRGTFSQPETAVAELERILRLFEDAQLPDDIPMCLLVMGDASRYSDDAPTHAYEYLTGSLELFRTLNNDFYAAWALHFMGRHALTTEGLSAAIRFQQESLALRERCGDVNGVLYAEFNLADYYLQMGKFEDSTRLFQRMLERSRETGERSSELMSTALLALSAFLRADLAQSTNLTAQTNILATTINHPLGISYALLLHSALLLLQDNSREASEALGALEPSQLHGVVRYWNNLLRAITSAADEAWDSVQQPLQQAIQYALMVQGAGVMAWCLPVCGFAAAHDGNFVQAASFIGLADKTGLTSWTKSWRAFGDLQTTLESKLGTDSYKKVIDAGHELDLRTTLEKFVYSQQREGHLRFPQQILNANASLDEPLSERELEVLAWIAQGLQNAEIAERLIVEMSTIKKHISHVYGKLGVTTRAQAILKAQQLGLV